MLETQFGLLRRPFLSSADLTCYYPATSHEAALDRLKSGLDDGESVLLLTGGPGTGKTLLCQTLLERSAEGLQTVFLTHTHVADRAGLLQLILFDLSLPYMGKGEQELRLMLIEHLVSQFAQGKRTLLVVDEAHLLSVDLLEELRLLGNLEGPAGKAVQVVLAGQVEISHTLARPEMASLRQRLAVRTALEPLGVEEAVDYLLHHLRLVGGAGEQVIDEEALGVIARATGGVPRLLNQVTLQALRLATESGSESVDVEVALGALAVFGLVVEDFSERQEAESELQSESEVGREEPQDFVSEEPVAVSSPACRLFIAPARIA